MANTKKTLSRIIAVLLVLGLSACGNTPDTSSTSTGSNTTEAVITVGNNEKEQDISSSPDTQPSIDSIAESVDSDISTDNNESKQTDPKEGEISLIETNDIDYKESKIYMLYQNTIQGLNNKKAKISISYDNNGSQELIMNEIPSYHIQSGVI